MLCKMSYKAFFMFSSGISKPMRVPPGTISEMTEHIKCVERVLNIKRVYSIQDLRNPCGHWDTRGLKDIDDKTLCEWAEKHNRQVEWFYYLLKRCSESPPAEFEELTPEVASSIWPGLEMIHVEAHRWTRDYYQARMEAFYSVMRGNEEEGITFDEEPLSIRQAAAVIRLFAEYLDKHDIRLDVPRDRDYLASSDDGGYDWCDTCGCAVVLEDAIFCETEGCALRAQMIEEDGDE